MESLTLGFPISKIVKDHSNCWETEVGKLIYTIILMDFCVFFIDLILLFGYKFVADRVIESHEMYFNIAYYTFNLIFSQTLVWLGIYFNPFLPVLQTIKLIIIFFINAFAVKKLYKMPKDHWSTATNNFYFLIVTFFTYLIILIGSIYVHVKIETSETCGPLVDFKSPFDLISKLKSILIDVKVLGFIIKMLTNSGFIAFTFFIFW
jgi:transmembrane channel-like protein